MIEKLSARSREESGFTLVELIAYILILSIISGLAVFNYMNMRETSQLNAAAEQVKAAMDNAVNLAVNQNRTVTLTFNDSNNTYEVSTSYVDPYGTTITTSEQPPAGVSYDEEGGKYINKLLDGQSDLSIESAATIVIQPQGVLMNITPASVTISCGGKSKTVSINELGNVTY